MHAAPSTRAAEVATPTAVTRIAVPSDVDPYWLDLLHRIGVHATPDPSLAAAVFVPPETADFETPLGEAAANGLPVLGDGRVLTSLTNREARRRAIRGISGTGAWFDGCPQIRIPAEVYVGDALVTVHRTEHGAPVIALPLPRAQDARSSNPTMHAFPLGKSRTGDEIVAGFDHGGLRRLVQNVLAQTVELRRVAVAPAGHSGTFAFRIDADDYCAASTGALLGALRRADIRATWFIDVERHAQKGAAAAVREIAAQGHEVQSHLYHHYTYRSAAKNRANLRRARAVLADWGIATDAVATPFGTFHEGVQGALHAEAVAWSSEFSAVYDDEPTRLTGRDQIPVHPVCPILLLQAGCSQDDVHEYYTARLTQGLRRGESVVFYGHPIGDLGPVPGLLAALRDVLERHADRMGEPVWQPNLSAFKQFHDRRRQHLRDETPDAGLTVRCEPRPSPMTELQNPTCAPWVPDNPLRLRRKQRAVVLRRLLREVRRR